MPEHDHAHTQATSSHQAPHHAGPDNDAHEHPGHGGASLNSMAASATLHCLTGCAIGEVLGLIIGTAADLSNGQTITLSVALAFLFGYSLSTLPLMKAGMALRAAIIVVFAADTLSIGVMEVVDNLVMAVIPGAMNAGLVNPTFWISMPLSLAAAFVVAYPVNRYLLQQGKGHALTHQHHDSTGVVTGARRFIPTFRTGALVAVIAAFMVGGFTVSVADDLSSDRSEPSEQMAH